MSQSPLEDYLDELFRQLASGEPRHARYLLSEAEAHLLDAVGEGMAAGMTEVEAERVAVARFGPAPTIAAAEARRANAAHGHGWLARALLTSSLLLGGLGGLAVGLSGLLNAAIRSLLGAQFLVDAAPGQILRAADCRRWLALDPRAASCHAAALADWANEVVFYRLAVGMLGGLALVSFLVLRRRWERSGRWAILAPTTLDAVALAVLGLALVGAVGAALNLGVSDAWHGAGQWLSAAIVTLGAAGWAGWRLRRDVSIG